MNERTQPLGNGSPVVIDGPEQSLVDTRLADAGLPPLAGVQSWCVFRATKDAPQIADQLGWTYHHHVDLAAWHGRLYVAWNSCQKDEDLWPSHELLSTSLDGVTWTPPVELFPQGVSTPLRMYFFRAPAGRMLAIGGLRNGTGELSEATKEGLVVREIHADHTLGEVYLLQAARGFANALPLYSSSYDAAFVESCRQLLADTVFLEQQDLGRLLGERRMKWHDAAAWPEGVVPGDDAKWVCGKAFSFFRRDGAIVGISKMGYTTTSTDDGRTWTQPLVPPTLVTGKAKVWSQQTPDGRYLLVYNPSRRTRYPLVAVSGEDGRHFGGMRVVHGELPVQRYDGRFRSIGPQYVRGISTWADDGSRSADNAVWLVYSVNKEDIWVSRLPLPVGRTPDGGVWNTYCPKWSTVTTDDAGVTLTNRDPYDYPIAQRVFEPLQQVTISFEITLPARQRNGDVEIDLVGAAGSPRAVRLRFDRKGEITLTEANGQAVIGTLSARGWTRVTITANTRTGTFDLKLGARTIRRQSPFAERATDIGQLVIRLGAYRGIGGLKPVTPGSDVPGPVAGLRIRNVRITPTSIRQPSSMGYQPLS